MLEYIILLIVTFITVPLTYLLIWKNNVKHSSIFIVFGGLFITFLGISMRNYFSLLFTILIIFTLVFALSILLNKYLNDNAVKTVEKSSIEVEKLSLETEKNQFKTLETIDKTEVNDEEESELEKDLTKWTISDQDDINEPKKEWMSNGE